MTSRMVSSRTSRCFVDSQASQCLRRKRCLIHEHKCRHGKRYSHTGLLHISIYNHFRRFWSASISPSSQAANAENMLENGTGSSEEENKRLFLVPKSIAEMKYYTQEKFSINYYVEGPPTGKPVILVHGFGASVGHWRKNIPKFASEGYRVYAIDLLGFGASEKPILDRYSLDLWRDLVQEFCSDMRKDEKWILCGNSIGALICAMVAHKNPQLTEAIVLLNCAGGLTSFRESELSFPSALVYLGFFRSFRTRKNILNLLNQVYINKDAIDEYLVAILHLPSLDTGAEHVFLKTLGGPAGPSPEELLPNIKCPILVIWGEDDPWTPYRRGFHPGVRFQDYNPNMTLISLPSTGHCPHDERPDQVHQVLFPWLSRVLMTHSQQL
eukprot:jgi/Galph1/3695/GphlegSOOS_G2335.1